MEPVPWTARGARRGGLIVVAAAAMALAGCSVVAVASSGAGAPGSTVAGGGQSASAQVPTRQLSAAGTAGGAGNYGVVASATQSAPRKALWYSQDGTPDLGVDTSQDFRTAVVFFGQEASHPTAVALEPGGSDTTLYDVSDTAVGDFISADGQWLVLVPGASVENPVTQVYRLTGTQALPVTFSVPPQVAAAASPGSKPTVLGFTASDQLLVDSGDQLWQVSTDGSTAQQFAASVAANSNVAGGVVDEVTGTPQAGIIAVETQAFNSNGLPSDSTVLLSPSGDVLHTFAGGSPGAFSPDGTHLIIVTTSATSATDASAKICDVATYSCKPGPSTLANSWLPNGDLAIGDTWWNPATGTQEPLPRVFRQFGLDIVLPTTLMTRIAALKPPTSYAPGGD
jgi:hypothetical protein